MDRKLLPYEHQLIEALGVSKEEYLEFVAIQQEYQDPKAGTELDIRNEAGTVAIVLTVVGILFQVGVGQPDSFAGFPIFENPAMADIATSAKSVIFGHLPSFKVRMAGGLQVASSTDYAFNQDLTYYRFLMRVDGNLTHAGHIKHFIGNAA